MTSAQLTEWMAYYELEPFGSRREDLRAAIQAIASVSPWRKQFSKRIRPEDVFPELGEGAGVPDAKVVGAKIRSFFAGMAEAQKQLGRA